METNALRDDQWVKVYACLCAARDVYSGNEAQCRRFIEGVHWMARSGAQWRELPERYGKWNTVYQRFSRWCDKGIWQRLHDHCTANPDLEAVIPDSTIIRAHPCAAGAPGKRGAKRRRAWGGAGAGSARRSTSARKPSAIPSGSR